MDMKTVSSSSSGIGFVGLLTIVFITLKLTGFIDWFGGGCCRPCGSRRRSC